MSRCDLLSVFLRPDEDIAREVREMLTQILLTDPASVTARVRNGIVTLAGQLGSAEQPDLIRVAVRLTWDIDGVVDVVNQLSAIQPIRPSIPVPGPLYSDKLPKPEEFVAGAYDFVEQLLSSQRKFAEDVIEATKPLLGAEEARQQPRSMARQQPGSMARQQPRNGPAAARSMARQRPRSMARQQPRSMPGSDMARQQPGSMARQQPGSTARQQPRNKARQQPGSKARQQPRNKARQQPRNMARQPRRATPNSHGHSPAARQAPGWIKATYRGGDQHSARRGAAHRLPGTL